ncbi:MAG: fused MFS/spermidine synthase [Myxococcota bacterium]|nr:fused MFS/spermidine synthase [Myxococcota bacterium]
MRGTQMNDETRSVDGAVPASYLRVILFSIFALSGVAGLMYEAVWGRYLRLFLGHSAYAQTFVIAIFMGGMAIGAWLTGRYSTRLKSLLRGYALIELAIGVLAFAFQPLFEASTAWAYDVVMPSLASPFAVNVFKQVFALGLIIVPSILLGMTFPLMSGGVIRLFPKISGSSLSMLYFTNSIGAAFGVMLTGLVLVKWVGLPGTVMLAGFLNILIGLVMLVITRNLEEPPLEEVGERVVDTVDDAGRPRLLLAVAGFTGLASFIYEIAWIRMLSMLLGSSSLAFEIMLATFIAGLAFGGLWIKRRIDTLTDPVSFLGKMQWIMGVLAIATVFFYNECFDLMRGLMSGVARTEEGYFLFNIGSNLLAALVMFPAAFCAGTTLPLITYSLLRKGYGERSIGTVYAANTVGAITGVFFSTHIGLPLLGLKGLICVGAGVDVILGLVLLWKTITHRKAIPAIALGLCTVLMTTTAIAIDFDVLKMASGVYRSGSFFKPETHESLFHEDGKTASIDVIREERSKAIVITTNGKPDASLYLDETRQPAHDATTQTLSGVMPMAVYPRAEKVAVIGFGSGMTSAMLLANPHMKRLDTIEIEPAMVEGARHFMPRNARVYEDPRSHIIYEDARTYFSAQKAKYDVIVSEPSNPWVSGVATLFSEEFYTRIVRHLNPGGILTQWLQLYELEPRLLASVLKALEKTFDEYTLFATDNDNILIVARLGKPIGPLSSEIFQFKGVKDELWRHRITDVNILELYRIANRQALSPLMASFEGYANSDYFPYLDAYAARSRFMRQSSNAIINVANFPLPVYDILGRHQPFTRKWLETPFPLIDKRQAVRFTGVERALRAVSIGRRLMGQDDSAPEPMPSVLIRSVEQARVGLIECGADTNKGGYSRHIAAIGLAITAYLDPASLKSLWALFHQSACPERLDAEARHWLNFFDAAGQRDATRLAVPAEALIESKSISDRKTKAVLVLAMMLADIVADKPQQAMSVWESRAEGLFDPGQIPMAFRVALSHASLARQGSAPKTMR